MRKLLAVCLVAGGLSVAAASASAQAVVHALAGTVHHVNQAGGLIVVNTDDGSGRFFKDADGKMRVSLDKALAAETTPASKFTETAADASGDHVIVFYCADGGGSNMRTVVAVDDLGKGPLEKTTGTVTHFDGHAHVLTIKNSAGTEQTFQIDAKTVAETSSGAVEGFKFDPEKGAQVRITATASVAGETALFIVPAI
jgi:hypothetical protein